MKTPRLPREDAAFFLIAMQCNLECCARQRARCPRRALTPNTRARAPISQGRAGPGRTRATLQPPASEDDSDAVGLPAVPPAHTVDSSPEIPPVPPPPVLRSPLPPPVPEAPPVPVAITRASRSSCSCSALGSSPWGQSRRAAKQASRSNASQLWLENAGSKTAHQSSW